MTLQRYKQYGKTITQSDGTTYQSGLPFVDFAYPGTIDRHQIDIAESSRPDILAWKLLNDTSLWPIICWMNNVIDPLTELTNLTTNPVTNVLEPNVIIYPDDPGTAQRSIIPFTYQQD